MRQDQQQVSSDRPEAVRSAPVPVPPPEDGPTGDAAARRGRDTGGRAEVPEDVLDDRGTFDDPTMADEHSGPDARRREADSDGVPEFHEPAPLPTAFGATTVGGAVAASAMASGRPEDERDPRGEDTVRPGDGAPGRTDAFDDERADPTAADRLHDRARWAAGDEHTGVRHADGTGSDRADGRGGADRTQQDAVLAGAAGYGRPEPSMIDPDATTPDARHAAPDALNAGAVTAAARPTTGAVPEDAATLFEPGIAQGFRDRWRDVQLRFVDDPRAAAGQAESLVEEAIEALATALAEQKNKLGDWQQTGDDTEQLRIAVRGYRDFLDRVLGR
uniref:Uncharacterized protein n=1 Tax=Micromonospora carbonacea TaxID=47853 RepID=A0A7D6CBK0_9ACTN|nr:hypothetical protein HZU44_23135 [Micromonospora carbonacea]